MRLHVGTATGAPVGRADAGRVPKDIGLLASWAAVILHQMHRSAGESFAQLLRIGDGGRAGDDLGGGAVVSAEPKEAAQQQRHVGSEYAGVHV